PTNYRRRRCANRIERPCHDRGYAHRLLTCSPTRKPRLQRREIKTSEAYGLRALLASGELCLTGSAAVLAHERAGLTGGHPSRGRTGCHLERKRRRWTCMGSVLRRAWYRELDRILWPTNSSGPIHRQPERLLELGQHLFGHELVARIIPVI